MTGDFFPNDHLIDRPARRVTSFAPPVRWGAIDRVEGRWVQGWARNPAKPAERVRVMCLLDGEIAGFASADQARSDHGPAAGHYGFRCELPPRKLHRARVITCLADGEMGLTLIHERVVQPPMVAPSAGRRAIHFDISDLLEFLVNHREVSGIQRVQCGYLSNALDLVDPSFAVRVCAQVPGAFRYVEIPNERAAAILQAIETRRSLPLADWREFIEIERAGSGRAPAFAPGDIILTMGAPWVHDGYFEAITVAMAEHGVHYFQIFHDLIPTLMPELVSIGLIGGFTKSMAGMLDCAAHVLANSQYSADDLRAACARIAVRCPPTSVIPLGGALEYGPAGQMAAPGSGFSPAAQYGEFVLCVGTIEPRKNHLYLYNVWKRLLAQLGPRTPKLICAGRMGWHVEDLQRTLKVSANLEGYFVHLTDIGDAELIQLYRDCLFTVFPSLYEGWGLPVAESLLYGKVCVASHATSMPEVGGEWAIYIDPHNIQNGFDVICGLLRDRARLAAIESRLRSQFRPMTWAAATDGLLATITQAARSLPARQPGGTDTLLPVALGKDYIITAAPTDVAPLPALRAEVELRSVERLLRGHDWHPPEAWGCWSCGPVARLAFLLDEPVPSRLFCYLQLRLPPTAPRASCDIFVDGGRWQRLEVQRGKDYDLRLDLVAREPPPAGLRRQVAIELRIDRLFEPHPDASDQRLLGIGIRSLCVCAADDVAQRLGYLERNFRPVSESKLVAEHDLLSTL